MADFVSLTCPSCGGRLQIGNDVNRFACSYCGGEHIVQRSGGIVSLAPVVAGLEKLQVGVDKTAAELAIRRLKSEIQGLQTELDQLQAQRSKALRNSVSILALAVLSLCGSLAPKNRSFLLVALPALILGLVFLAPLRNLMPEITEVQGILERKLTQLWQQQAIVEE